MCKFAGLLNDIRIIEICTCNVNLLKHCRVVWFLVDFSGRMSGVALSVFFFADNDALFKISKFDNFSTTYAI